MMGGSSKNKDKNDPNPTTAATMPQTRTFGGAVDPNVIAQLRSSGLLGTMPKTMPFGPVTVPILSRPDEVEAYLKSIGKTPTALGSTSTGSKSEKPFIKHGSI
jgi:hypothetical protein